AAQRQYFDQEGVEAWAGAVPFYITSNPFIANAYAEVFIRYVQDLIQKGANPKAPFYVFELGTGSGRFSFLCMKTLFRLQEALGIDANIVYVMTDFTESNLKFWQQHERLKPYVEAGKLDFARYDMDQDSALYLVNRNLTLKPGSLENPLMLVANYIFDTVSHDAFRVSNGTLYESLISLETGSENVRNGMPIKLDGVESHFEHRPILEAYYHQPILDGILHRYAQLLINSTFLFPVGAFKSLDCFRALSQGRMLLISTDKGYHSLFELEGRDDPRPVMHGSFSMSVNFHAIGEYFRALKGDFLFHIEGPELVARHAGHRLRQKTLLNLTSKRQFPLDPLLSNRLGMQPSILHRDSCLIGHAAENLQIIFAKAMVVALRI
ncbi:MAG: hypothetical protein EBX40_08510, partial [Gammaproteobacteria bacterium]|nr:hypothetical protein [Gammaproteobacteria bacterium]